MQIPPTSHSSGNQQASPTPLQAYQSAENDLNSAQGNLDAKEWADMETDLRQVQSDMENVNISSLPTNLQESAKQLLQKIEDLNHATLPPKNRADFANKIGQCMGLCQGLINGLGSSS